MGVLLVSAFVAYFGGVGSMSADAFILLMPTGGAVAPSCVPASVGGSGTAAFSVVVGAAPFTLCP
jgi:hypothetical protein